MENISASFILNNYLTYNSFKIRYNYLRIFVYRLKFKKIFFHSIFNLKKKISKSIFIDYKKIIFSLDLESNFFRFKHIQILSLYFSKNPPYLDN